MRTLQLSHRDIELIEKSLNHVYNSQIKLISDNRKLMEEEQVKLFLDLSNEYDDLRIAISDGMKDV